MPAARGVPQAGLTTAHVWMIVFVVLWLVATGLLVWVYTDQETTKKDNDSLRAENSRLISSSERNLPAFTQGKASGPTVVGLVEGARAETALMASGDEADVPATVQEKTNAILNRIRDDGLVPIPAGFAGLSLVEALNTLYDAYTGLHQRWDEAQTRAEDLNQQVLARTEANERERAAFDEKLGELSEKFAALEADRERFRDEKAGEIAAFDSRIDEIRQQASRDIQEQRSEITRLNSSLREYKTRYAELQTKLGEQQIKPLPLETLRQPDGQVLTAVPGEDIVYVDLGQDARLTLGLQFAVYPAEQGIPADGRAKARIEVVSIYDRSAACKIVAVLGREPIRPGDLIANPIYDHARPLKFMVIGEFDLEHNGRPDDNGIPRIEALIERWGGQIADAVSADVDFMVVGTPPQVPTVLGDASPEFVEHAKTLADAFDHYSDQLEAATGLAIPLLRQEVFMHFLGYRSSDVFPIG
jgi:hypothetical protein